VNPLRLLHAGMDHENRWPWLAVFAFCPFKTHPDQGFPYHPNQFEYLSKTVNFAILD